MNLILVYVIGTEVPVPGGARKRLLVLKSPRRRGSGDCRRRIVMRSKRKG